MAEVAVALTAEPMRRRGLCRSRGLCVARAAWQLGGIVARVHGLDRGSVAAWPVRITCAAWQRIPCAASCANNAANEHRNSVTAHLPTATEATLLRT